MKTEDWSLWIQRSRDCSQGLRKDPPVEEGIQPVLEKYEELTLTATYKGRCGYCENQMFTVELDHHRPTGAFGPKQAPGFEYHQGYPWLQSDPNNLVLSCHTCNHVKRAKYPIQGKRAAGPLSPCIELEVASLNKEEEPFLLHPHLDDSREHLEFLPRGLIKGTTERGRKTIKVLKLESEEFVRARFDAENQLLQALAILCVRNGVAAALRKVHQEVLVGEWNFSSALLRCLANLVQSTRSSDRWPGDGSRGPDSVEEVRKLSLKRLVGRLKQLPPEELNSLMAQVSKPPAGEGLRAKPEGGLG